MEAAVFHGSLPFIIDPVTISRGGRGTLDSFRARILCSEDWEKDARTLGFEMDRKLSGWNSLWVKTMDPEPEAETVFSVEISGEGLGRAGDRRQRQIQCGEQQTSIGPDEKVVIVWSSEESGQDPETGDPIDSVPRRVPKLDSYGEVVFKSITTPSGTMDRWQISEPEITVLDTYFTTSKPPMDEVGSVFDLPNPPEVPAYPWSGYGGNLRGRHPNGWVLADREVDELYRFSDEIGLWRVKDAVTYRHPAFPD